MEHNYYNTPKQKNLKKGYEVSYSSTGNLDSSILGFFNSIKEVKLAILKHRVENNIKDFRFNGQRI